LITVLGATPKHAADSCCDRPEPAKIHRMGLGHPMLAFLPIQHGDQNNT
jgi:hypothetical protein